MSYDRQEDLAIQANDPEFNKEMNRQSGLVLHKVIYAKRTAFTKKDLLAVLQLEADNHVRNRPDLVLVSIGESIKNADRSIAYPMHFKYK